MEGLVQRLTSAIILTTALEILCRTNAGITDQRIITDLEPTDFPEHSTATEDSTTTPFPPDTSELLWAHLLIGSSGKMLITCYFTEHATAMGCHVAVNNSETFGRNIERKSGSQEAENCFTLSTTGVSPSLVRVFEWEQDGSIADDAIEPMIETLSREIYACSQEANNSNMISFQKATRVVLFISAASLFLAATAVIVAGLLCKLGSLHRHFKHQSYRNKVLQGDVAAGNRYESSYQ